jgi:hypothetical protein
VRSSDKTFSCFEGFVSRLNVEDGFFFFFLSAAQNNLCFDLTFLKKDFRDHLKELAELEGTSILFATHLLREVEDLCDKNGLRNPETLTHTKGIRFNFVMNGVGEPDPLDDRRNEGFPRSLKGTRGA